ncbi:MAG: hypothetical protein NC489_31010 [Ruminococcus flavefaciens]|nr:hypothetical protein [Ruminococcus flavefaciens]
MNIKSNGKILVLAKNAIDRGEGRDRTTYYNFAILIDGEAGNISCTEEAYDKAVINTLNGVVYAYNDKYKTFRIVDIVPESSVLDHANQNASSDAKPDAKPDPKADKPASSK